MATHSSILAWRIPGTEEPGRLWSIVLQRVRHNKQFSMHACIRSYLVTIEITWAYPILYTGRKVQESRLLLGLVGLRSQICWMPVLFPANGPFASPHFTAFVYQEIHVTPCIPPTSDSQGSASPGKAGRHGSLHVYRATPGPKCRGGLNFVGDSASSPSSWQAVNTLGR